MTETLSRPVSESEDGHNEDEATLALLDDTIDEMAEPDQEEHVETLEEAASSDETAEDGPELQEIAHEDQEHRFEDRELLGKSFLVRRSVRTAAHTSTNRVAQTLAGARNLAAQPGKWRREILHNLAERSHSRREQRIENAKSELVKAFHRKRLVAAETKRNTRKAELDSHVSEMTKRTEKAKGYGVAGHQEYINGLKDKKGAALARKEFRVRLHNEELSFLERRKAVKDLTSEQLSRVAGAALVSEAASREAKKANSSLSKLDRLDSRAKTKLDRAQEKHAEATEVSDKASKEVEMFEERLPAIQERIEEAEARLDGLEADDMIERIDIESELLGLKQKRDLYERRINALNRLSEDSERRADRQQGRREEYHSRRVHYAAQHSRASERVRTARGRLGSSEQAKRIAIDDVFTNKTGDQ